MKEYLEKFLGLFSEGVAKMQDWKEDEALTKMKEASEMTEDLIKKSEENTEVDLKKFFESEDGKETLKKYVDMYLSATDVSSFIEQVKELVWSNESLSKKVEKLEKEKQKDDEVIEKALNSQFTEIDEIKKTLEKRVSKID